MPKISKARKEECRARLLEILKPGDTVMCVLRHVSRSGMLRHIDFYKLEGDSQRWLSGMIADLGEYSQAEDGSVKVSGCGMDMGFSVVYNTSSRLYPDGFTCTGERCPSNDHSNGDRDRTPHKHSSGGYAISSRWL